MSDEKVPGSGEEPIKQLKSEFERKMGNSEARMAELTAANQSLLSKIEDLTKHIGPKVEPRKADLSSLLYSDPEAYAVAIQERADARAEKIVDDRLSAMTNTNSHINKLYGEFPELSDESNPLTKRSLEVYNSMSANEKKATSSLRLAVLEAASELGVKPKSKRPDDEPVGSGNGPAPRRRNTNKLDAGVEEWASIMGLDTSNPKTKENLLKRQQRDFTKWTQVKGD